GAVGAEEAGDPPALHRETRIAHRVDVTEALVEVCDLDRRAGRRRAGHGATPAESAWAMPAASGVLTRISSKPVAWPATATRSSGSPRFIDTSLLAPEG